LIVDHDEIRKRVEDLQPMTVRLIHAGKQASILESHRRMPNDRLEQQLIVGGERLAAVRQVQASDQLTLAALQSTDRQILPAESLCQRTSKQICRRSRSDRDSTFCQR